MTSRRTPHATDADIVAALVETFRGSRSMLFPNAGRLVWRRLVDVYGEKVVERALRVRLREASREQRALQGPYQEGRPSGATHEGPPSAAASYTDL
jgi:hypothetical protein